MAKRRGVKNKVYQLPEDIRKELNNRLLNKQFELKDLLDFINSHPDNTVTISSSGLNRYAKLFDKEMKDLQDIDYLLKNLPKEIEFDDESKIHKLLAQILSKAVLTFSMGREDFDAKELSFMAKALKDIMASTKDRERIKSDLRKEVEKELKQAQTEKLKTAKDGGKISKKSFEEAIRILGL